MKKAQGETMQLRAEVERLHQQLDDAMADFQQVQADMEQLQAAHQEVQGENESLEQLAEERTHAIQLLQQDKRRLSLALRNVRRCRVSGPRLTRHQRHLMNILMRHRVSPEVLQRCAEGGYGIPSGTTAQQPCPTPDPPALTANFIPTQVGRRGKPAARTAAYLAQHYLSTARLVLQTQVSRRKLGMCRELFVNEQCQVPNPHRPGQITTVGRQLRVVAKYLKSKTLELMGGEFTLSPDMVLGTKAMEVKWLERDVRPEFAMTLQNSDENLHDFMLSPCAPLFVHLALKCVTESPEPLEGEGGLAA
ncbi:hypothetical protein QJQ45_018272 [Haematococcus lacustris]|nr:hypothetical protein QJQ45_018272 [Haematococcus lacustris]